METAPYDERLAFWKWQQAFMAFDQVHKLCDFILREKISESHHLHIPLMTGLHTLYARPFKQRREVRLSDAHVPDCFKDLHASLITMRDKIHAHTDADGPLTANNEPFNKAAAIVRNGSFQFVCAFVFSNFNEIEKVRDLSEALSRKAEYNADKIWKRCMKRSHVRDGNYEVNLSKSDDSFLKPLSW